MSPEEIKRLRQIAAQAGEQHSNTQQSTQKPAKGGRGGLLTSLISEGGAIGGGIKGAAIGAGFGGPVGSVVGGGVGALLGGFGGRLLENKVRDDREIWDKSSLAEAGKEGAISGVFGAGPIKLAKGASAAGGALLKSGGKVAAREAAETAITKPGIIAGVLNKGRGLTDDIARQADMKSMGIEVGGKVRNRVIDTDVADELYDFARTGAQKYGGVKTGRPITQAKDATNVFKKTVQALKSARSKINRGAKKSELSTIDKSVRALVSDDASITGASKTSEKLLTNLKKAKDLDAIERVREMADDIAFTATGAGKTSAAAQARHVRNVIDDFITNLSDEGADAYKAVKKDFILAKDLKDLISKGSKSAGGSMKSAQNLVGAVGNTQTSRGIISKLSGLGTKGGQEVSEAGAKEVADAFALKPIGVASRVLAGRGLTADGMSQPVDEMGLQTGFDPSEEEGAMDTFEPSAQDIMGAPEFTEDEYDPYSPDNLRTSVQQILSQGGNMKDVSEFLSIAKTLNEIEVASQTTGQKKLTATQETRAIAAQNALKDIPMVRDAIESGKLGGVKNIPGSGTQIGRRILGTEDLDAALFNIADNILRARSGAATPEPEVKRFAEGFLPSPMDSKEAKIQKLERAVRELEGYVNPSGAIEDNPQEIYSQLGI